MNKNYSILGLISLFALMLAVLVTAEEVVRDQPKTFVELCQKSCVDKGLSESICTAGCQNPDGAIPVCMSECSDRGMSEALCTKVCEAAKTKILELKDCYDNCIAKHPAAECENQCFAEVRAIAERVENREIILKVSSDSVAIVGGGRKVEIFSNESVDLLELDGKKFIKVPVNLSAGEKLESFTDPETGIKIEGNKVDIPSKDDQGKPNGHLILNTKDGVVGDNGRGTAEIEDATLALDEKKGSLSDEVENASQYTAPSLSLNVSLKDIPTNSSVTIGSGDMTNDDKDKFKGIIDEKDNQTKDFKVKDVVMFEVSKKNMDDVKYVNNATLRIKVDKKAVEGKLVKIVRKDGNTYEELSAKLVGEEGGMLVFEAYSPNGLSLYALMTVEYMAPTEEKKLPIDAVLIGAVVIIVIAIGAVVMLGRKNPKSKTK